MQPDFYRQVHCVLGLPFDSADETRAAQIISAAAMANQRCILSTPNLNFAIGCLTDAAFRASVVNSNLSTADGMPIVWICRLLRIPIGIRASGSGIFQRLRDNSGDRIAVYFFGGPDGAAATACRRLNASGVGMHCVGFASPGFGSIEDLSSGELIAAINASHADFLIVSLGAKKGQAWIERNMAQLQIPVISHLGAVVNFVAGTVSRAPVMVQTLGLEWMWRIKEEPTLWRRYFADGLALMRLAATRVLPHALSLHVGRSREARNSTAQLETTAGPDGFTIHLSGAWVARSLAPLRDELHRLAPSGQHITLNLRGVTIADKRIRGVDSTSGWVAGPQNRTLFR